METLVFCYHKNMNARPEHSSAFSTPEEGAVYSSPRGEFNGPLTTEPESSDAGELPEENVDPRDYFRNTALYSKNFGKTL